MIKLKNNKIKVKCLECKKYHEIEIKHISTEKEQRNISYEYEHIYDGYIKCDKCGDKIGIILEIYEYPKTFVNSIYPTNKGCTIVSDISFNKNIIDIK